MTLTKPQIRELQRAARMVGSLTKAEGVVTRPAQTAGLAASSWERMMVRMCDAGLFRAYVHGGYEITDEGRRLSTGLDA